MPPPLPKITGSYLSQAKEETKKETNLNLCARRKHGVHLRTEGEPEWETKKILAIVKN